MPKKFNLYAALEIAFFGLASGVFALFFPDDTLVTTLIIVAFYFLLQPLSAARFCIALHRRQVIESPSAPYNYTLTPAAKQQWLVMRFCWLYLVDRMDSPKPRAS